MIISTMNIALRPNRSAAEQDGADQDAEQADRADDPFLGRADLELARDQRQGDAGHEHDEALEELPGRREGPDAPLHPGHWHAGQRGAVRPDRPLVDIVLHGARRGRGGRARRQWFGGVAG
ncbi:MAG: hypothetical protein JOY66_14070 [Acetobacteraceae bacterium]|nr:hypothetical protein [Acetobacteraceae bacterium]